LFLPDVLAITKTLERLEDLLALHDLRFLPDVLAITKTLERLEYLLD